MAQIEGTEVRLKRSTLTSPFSPRLTPAASSPSPAVEGSRPVASSTASKARSTPAADLVCSRPSPPRVSSTRLVRVCTSTPRSRIPSAISPRASSSKPRRICGLRA